MFKFIFKDLWLKSYYNDIKIKENPSRSNLLLSVKLKVIVWKSKVNPMLFNYLIVMGV
tara:strand:+ start:94637 stop:94810 length:174 start_codon:yes stop_codon:yes gene_type:complete